MTASLLVGLLLGGCGSGSDRPTPAPAPVTPAPVSPPAAEAPAVSPDPPGPAPAAPEPAPAAPEPARPALHVEVHQRGAVTRAEWTWDAAVGGPTPTRWWVYEYGTACANQPFRDPWGAVTRMRNSDQFPSHAPGWLHVNATMDSGGCDSVRICPGPGRAHCSDPLRWPGR